MRATQVSTALDHDRRQARRILAAVILGGILMGLALGARHVQGLFLVPMTVDRDWTREGFGFAIAIQNLVWGFAQPISGMIADRFGSVRVIAAGTVLYALGLVSMASATTPFGLTLGAGLVIGIALSCTSFGAIYGALSRIVPENRRPWALGMAGAVGGAGQFIMVPTAQALIHSVGWISALVVLALLVALATPAAASLNDRHAAQRIAVIGAGSIRLAVHEAFTHRGFLLLNAGFFACGFQLAFIGVHLPAYLLDKGLPATTAVNGLAIIAFTNVIGTYWCGILGGMWRRKFLLAWLYLIRSAAIALFALLPLSNASVYAFCAAMGLIWLGTVPLTNGLVSQVFGVRYISTLFGFVFFGHQLGAFAGAWLGGMVFDATGSYQPIWILAVLVGVLAAAVHIPIDDAKRHTFPITGVVP